jgi:predicted metalloprotease with PDZ domain
MTSNWSRGITKCLWLSLLFAFAASSHFSNAAESVPSPAVIRYTLVLGDPEQHLVHVKLDIPPGPAEHDLQLPVWNALYQVRDFAQYVNRVYARDAAGKPIAVHQMDKSRWHIDHAERGAEVEYETFADEPGPFGAQLNSDHAFFNLAEILIYPTDERADAIQLGFDSVPPKWRIATALAGSAEQGFSADNYDRLVDAPVELGTFQEADFDEGGGHYRVIVDADPADYDMQKIVATDRSVAAAEALWMNDRPFSTYVFIYHFPRGSGGGGMEHANSTAITFSATRLAEDPYSLPDVTAHEFFHLWNVKRIRPQSLEPVDYAKENYTTALWFSEGVTTSAAEIGLRRAGLMDEPRFLKGLAGQIRELEDRPAHLTQSAEQSSIDTWLEKYDYYWLPERSISYYNKGFLLGIMLDLQIRKDSQGRVCLRDLFQWMNDHYARQGRFFPDSAGVREAAEAVSHSDLGWFFQKYVTGTDEIPWDDFFKTVGLHLVRSTMQVADPGFSLARRYGRPPTVARVDANSEARKAGLTAGDVIQEVNGQPAGPDLRQKLERLNPGDLLSLRVRGPGGERELKWKVGARERIDFELKDDEKIMPEQKARRAAWLRGESQPVSEAHP